MVNPVEYLSEEEIRPFLSWEQLIPAVEQALISFSLGRMRQPLRSILTLPEQGGLIGLMPAADEELIGVKLVTVFEGNAGRNLPTHQAVIQLLSATTGEPLIAMDGRLITEMRTAAVSAAATRLLSSPDARLLAILGSGVQARAHLDALRSVRDFQEVRVWSRTEEHAKSFAAAHAVSAFPSAEAAVRGADVVVTVSSTREPLVRGEWLRALSLVCAVGAVGPDRRELDDAAMRGAVVVESREAALRESGDLIGSRQPIFAELGELLAGAKSLPNSRVVFKSLGIAATDLAAARLVWKRRQEQSGVRR